MRIEFVGIKVTTLLQNINMVEIGDINADFLETNFLETNGQTSTKRAALSDSTERVEISTVLDSLSHGDV